MAIVKFTRSDGTGEEAITTEDFAFWLEPGVETISIGRVRGPLTEIAEPLSEVIRRIHEAIKYVTGSLPPKHVRGLADACRSVADYMELLRDDPSGDFATVDGPWAKRQIAILRGAVAEYDKKENRTCPTTSGE